MSKGLRNARQVTEKNNFAHLAVALVLLLFGLALTHEIGIVPGEVAVEVAVMVALASGV
jgi:hypothetical protein